MVVGRRLDPSQMSDALDEFIERLIL